MVGDQRELLAKFAGQIDDAGHCYLFSYLVNMASMENDKMHLKRFLDYLFFLLLEILFDSFQYVVYIHKP